jgi:hypothetical protein
MLDAAGPHLGQDNDIMSSPSSMQEASLVPAGMTGSILGSWDSPQMVSSGNLGGPPPQVANETCINDTAARQVSIIAGPPRVRAVAEAEAGMESSGAAGAAGEVLDDRQIGVGSSSSQIITSIPPVGEEGLGIQLSASSSFSNTVDANAESEGGLCPDGDPGSDEEGTDFEGDSSSSLDRTSVVVQLSVRYDKMYPFNVSL